MPPKEIYIIRHCDKPSDYKLEGPNDPMACLCSEQGYYRSYLLPYYWKNTLKNVDPSALYASNFSPNDPKCSCEQREMLVLVPTSKTYDMKIQMPYCFTQIKEISEEIMKQNGTVIIGWEHHHIPILANALGVREKIGQWPEDRFDIVFRLRRDESDTKYDLTISTQEFGLNGDSKTLPKDYRKFRTKNAETLWKIVLLIVIISIFMTIRR